MSPWAIVNALVHSRHELGKITGLEKPTSTHGDTLENRYASRRIQATFPKALCVHPFKSRWACFNSVLAVHLLGVDAGHGQAAVS